VVKMAFPKNFALYRDRKLAEKVAEKIKEIADGEEFKFMHVCGTHEDTISRFGLRSILPQNVKVIAGPGCPVCVTPPEVISAAIELSKLNDVILATYGDMAHVPSPKGSLVQARAEGGDVHIVYSITDAVKLANKRKDKQIIHFAIGFETTAPSTAATLLNNPPENFTVLTYHLLIPPAIDFLLSLGEVKLDGFILPGHVSTIIGSNAYKHISERWNIPQVVAGFEPLDVLVGIYMLLKQIREGRAEVENEYVRAVRPEGNVKAKEMMKKVFDIVGARWRGIGVIPRSGFKLKKEFEEFDAGKRFEITFEEFKQDLHPGCKCGEILRGLAQPEDCPLFAKVCTPLHPIGPCMVSREGTCAIIYKYSRPKK